MMLAKRRLTLTRSVYLGITTVLLLLLIFFSKNYPLDIITQHQASVLGGILSRNKPQSEPHPDLAGPKRTESFSACHLFQLHREKTATRGDTVASQCHRVPPVPGSCDVAERLFHSSPPGHCDDQGTVEICTVKHTSSGFRAVCSEKVCDSTLSGATINTNTGILQWRKFISSNSLETWINGFLVQSGVRKHFGFVFIGCGGEWTDFDGKHFDTIDDEEMLAPLEAMQILLLPPSVLTINTHKESQATPEFDINFNFIFIDSVSRQHFFRSLPKTVKLFEKFSNKSSGLRVLDFELVQSVRSRTFETLQVLFSGEIDPSVKPFGVLELPPEPLKTEKLLRMLKQRGYSTLWLEDLCYLWEWGLSKDLQVHNKTLTSKQTWEHLQQALARAGIDSLDVTYAMCRVLSENGVPDHFHGPDVVCLNGRHQHDYLLDYLWLYQETLAKDGRPFFTFMETNVGHEDTGRRIQTLDQSLSRYLQHAATLDNTLTIVMSDHGNSYGKFLENTMEGRMELFHPHLFMLVPRRVEALLGHAAMEALRTNQHRLISHLDLHYMLLSLALKEIKKPPIKHRYSTTSRGLLTVISSARTCNHIPRIMPNLCICENFDMPVDSDAYHALFAHMAVGKINNEIQQQYHQQVVQSGGKPRRGFGHCRQLHLSAFNNVRKSFSGNKISLKMDLVVPLEYDPEMELEEPQSSSSQTGEIFFVAMQLELDKGDTKDGSVILQTLDRITPYSKFSVCADASVKLQLCLCDVNATMDKRADKGMASLEDLGKDRLSLTSEVFTAEGSDGCLVLILRKNNAGGVFSVANVCQGRMFQVLFRLEVVEMIVSDAMPSEKRVFPGQELFLCMAVKRAPKVEWEWSFTLHLQQHSV